MSYPLFTYIRRWFESALCCSLAAKQLFPQLMKSFRYTNIPQPVAVVPDLFRGHPWAPDRSRTEYEAWREPHTFTRVQADVRTALEALRQRGMGQSFGLLGFCFGGGRLMETLALASRGLNPNAAVAFYPTSTYSICATIAITIAFVSWLISNGVFRFDFMCF